MRICQKVPKDARPEILQMMRVVDRGGGCNATTVIIIARKAKYFTTTSTIQLSVSQSSVPNHIRLDIRLSPILPYQAGPVLLNAM
jgi:hypothetical protein